MPQNNITTTPSAATLQARQRFGIVGNAPALNAAIERAIRVAPIDLSVLVTGESGSGKEFFPQIIHNFSSRKHAKYIAVNCGAIPEGTIDSELFGHEKGAFTGAVDSRRGYFEEASGGTIFLDEVAELPLTTQARLLRVLESGEYLRVGSSTVQKTNIRVVAATHVDLPAAVAAGKFREDLYYRLSTVEIHIPPLRDRGNDINLLARRFSSAFAERYHMPQVSFTQTADDALRHYRWPGNVRQLKNVIEQVSLFEAGKEVDTDILKGYLPEISTSYIPATSKPSHSYDREREMLLGMIFKLRERIDELSQRLDDAVCGGYKDESVTVHKPSVRTDDDHASMLPAHIIVHDSYQRHSQPVGDGPLPVGMAGGETMRECSDVGYSEVTPSEGSTALPCRESDADAPLTLEETEREMIRRALERNQGRRKAAAAELRISERTLYRKIKDYDLE
ncbi:MAG: sigma-54 dependent transcriptional regulator [Muribaculaceae bacterium]|nr:sigma-54 dependent transcriptional regulator [Muribaculaceae bacterium]